MNSLNQDIVSRIQFPLPSPEQQRKVVAVLTAYDDLIANNQRRIALLESMAEEIYREWFVRMRFPGAKPETFVKGLPQGWSNEPIGGAFKFFGGATPSKDVARYWTNGDINWFTPTDITAADGIYLESSRDRCTEDGLHESRFHHLHTERAVPAELSLPLAQTCEAPFRDVVRRCHVRRVDEGDVQAHPDTDPSP
jgi:type I restriction enzyme S subunit